MKIISTLLLAIILTAIGYSQEQNSPKELGVIVPREIAIPLVVHQPNCPLKLEFAELHAYLNGGGQDFYKFRNQSDKVITGFKIATLFPGGTGGSVTAKSRWIAPGETYPESDKDNEDPFARIVPLTDDIRKQLKMDKETLGFMSLIVVRVEFSDGTVFSDENVYKAFKDFLEKIDKK